jgi:glycosyltransferase involved in cell wall biosynthesis
MPCSGRNAARTAADVLLFTARGSDEGHRAVLEAMACGVVPVTFPIEGMRALLGDLAPSLIADAATPDAAASKVIAVTLSDIEELRRRSMNDRSILGMSRRRRG